MFRTIIRELIGCALLAAGLGVAACTSITGSSVSSTTISTYTQTTGIEIDANALFQHEGCGQGAGVVFKYVTIVYNSGGHFDNDAGDGGLLCPVVTFANAAPAIAINDCFSDAVFVNLGLALGESQPFDVVVYAFDAKTFDANAQTIFDAVGGQEDIPPTPQAGFVGCAANIDEGQLDFELRSIANWTAACTALQEPNVQSLAACGPLVATGN